MQEWGLKGCRIIEERKTSDAVELAATTANSAMDAIAAIEGAIRIVDLWLPKVTDEAHQGESEALHEMYRAFLKVTQQCHQ